MTSIIGLGGGCHWCTEGIFQSLIGVKAVKQGWIAPTETVLDRNPLEYSEAIEVYFDPQAITLASLIEIHLYTHASTSNHSMRSKYRSAIYAYNSEQYIQAKQILDWLRQDFDKPIVTHVYSFDSFKSNKAEYLNYFYQAPNKPFCQSYIHPKLRLLLAKFKSHVDRDKLASADLEL